MALENASDIAKTAMLYGAKVLSPGKLILGIELLTKKKKTHPGTSNNVSHLFCVTAHCL